MPKKNVCIKLYIRLCICGHSLAEWIVSAEYSKKKKKIKLTVIKLNISRSEYGLTRDIHTVLKKKD